MAMVKIVIIEDNVYARTAWESTLSQEEDFVVLATFSSCEEALESELVKKATVVLLDIGLKGISGIKGAELIGNINPKALIIMISIHDDDKSIFGSLQAGAIGFLHKSVSPDELIESIRIAIRGGSPMTPQIARRVLRSFHRFKPMQEKDNLTEKEITILNHLSEGKSYKKISEEMYLSVDGIKYHVRSIYEKLHVHSQAEAVSKGQALRILTKWE